jgi:hypothetical protein
MDSLLRFQLPPPSSPLALFEGFVAAEILKSRTLRLRRWQPKFMPANIGTMAKL